MKLLRGFDRIGSEPNSALRPNAPEATQPPAAGPHPKPGKWELGCMQVYADDFSYWYWSEDWHTRWDFRACEAIERAHGIGGSHRALNGPKGRFSL